MIVGLSSGLGGGADTALSLLLAGFVFYMAFDSMRTAKAKQLGEATIDPLESWSKERPIGPIILIGVGVLFLLNNFSWFPFYKIERFWPLILIAVGVLMFRNRLGRPS
jgi:multisubunit Na+/H+ antiporter MnhB subunit